MEKQIARQFRQKVQALLEDESERDTLYTSLREYHESMSLSELITDLRKVVNSPDRMELFEDVRPLIPLKHQVEYDKIVPNRLARKARIVKLVKNGPDSLGFSLRGGIEHGVGIYVAHVVPSSPAEISGLRVGDEVLRINGYSVNESTHEEIVLLTQSTNYIEMKIRHIGMLPIKRTRTDQLRWEYVHPVPGSPESPNGTVLPSESVASVPDTDHTHTAGPPPEPTSSGEVINNMSNGAPSPKMGKEDRRVFVNLEGTPGLGCSICGGPAYKPGVFVKNVKPGSIAEEIGLKLGDQFLDVNGINLTHADYGEGEELFKDNIIPKKSIHLDNEPQPQDSEEKRAEREELERLRQIAVDREKKRQKKETEERIHQSALAKLKQRQDELQRLREAEEKKKQEEEQQSKLQKRKSEEDDEEISRQLEQELLNLSLTQQKLDDEKKQEESRKHQESRTQAQRRESERKEKQTRQELDRLSEHDKKRRKELELQQKLEEQNRLQQEKEERMRIHRLQQEAKESEREIQREQQWLSQEAEKDLRKPNLIPSPPKTYMSPSAAQGVRRTPSRIGQDKLSPEKFDPASLFTKPQIAGREIRMIKIKKEKDTDLGVTVEGGIDSVLGGKVIVTEVWEGGLAHRHGGLYKGDQIMNCNGRTMLDIKLARAQEILREEMKAAGDSLTLVIAVAPPKAYEDEVKKLTHTLAMGDIQEEPISEHPTWVLKDDIQVTII
ncbi:harmonin-like isoform X2 [Branchiostoma lanceolatum]|uniref:harmonin-like isoform X2 n=1 Tax=Branchiostoma lanceolatum TaxID=7740 RepID=UPI0034567AC1